MSVVMRQPLRSGGAADTQAVAEPRRASAGTPRLSAPAVDAACLRAIARALDGVPVRIVLWSGAFAGAGAVPVATVRINDRATLVQLAMDPDVAFGEGYRAGRIEVDGDLVGMLAAIVRKQVGAGRRSPALVRALRAARNTLARARRNVAHHYDLGNDFYRLWLDREMVYTCAYFPTPEASLEEAQIAKMDLVARKLVLRPGEVVFEAGCGWGALALHLARHYGVRVRAWNVSHEQVGWARERTAREGLSDRVEFVEDDYRHMTGRCDAFVSVGMLEHVGRPHYAALADTIDRTLDRTGGRGLLHFIGRNAPAPTGRWIARRIFPGTHIPSLGEAVTGVLEPHTLAVVDVENLQPHYARTLAHWLSRFRAVEDEVTRRFGEPFTRMWRLYLAEAQAGFLGGNLQLFQVTFARPTRPALRWTRAELYGEAPTQ